jgi:tripartite-type tricarboxylate transporter receptor subunit TctC
VPWPAGGSSDITLRAYAEAASKVLGQPLVIDNKAGASGTLGAATLATTAKPDGYTIAQLPITVFRLPVMQKVVWDPLKDFTYISHLSGYTFGITTKADSPFKTFKDVIEFAKANPGKVTYATPGAGTSLHIGTELIAGKAGVKLTQVPFKGGAETNAAVLGGHTMLQADSTGWKALVDSGQLRLLCVWTSKRTRSWPDVPTLKELGYDLVFESPYGVGGPKGMDPAAVKKIDEAFRIAAQDKHVIETHDKFDMPVTYMDPAAYDSAVRKLYADEKAALEQLGLAKKA